MDCGINYLVAGSIMVSVHVLGGFLVLRLMRMVRTLQTASQDQPVAAPSLDRLPNSASAVQTED